MTQQLNTQQKNVWGVEMKTIYPPSPYATQEVKKNFVEHPEHYGGDTTYETIKVIEAWGLDFHLGNAIKYISRAGIKNPEKKVEDLQKAIWYINRKIQSLKQRHYVQDL